MSAHGIGRLESLGILRGLRGVDTPCDACSGMGVRHYAHGSTWRGGMGVSGFTWDVCDVCWGSGDASRRGVDLRKMEAKRAAWEKAQVHDYLRKRLGVRFDELGRRVAQLADLAEKQSRKRKLPDGEDWWRWVRSWEQMAEILRELVPRDRGAEIRRKDCQ